MILLSGDIKGECLYAVIHNDIVNLVSREIRSSKVTTLFIERQLCTITKQQWISISQLLILKDIKNGGAVS